LIRFFIFGHKNILATHKNTIEFTKDEEVSSKGDCILGVRADFNRSSIREILKFDIIKVTIKIDDTEDSLEAQVNKDFDDDHEIVIRIGEFASKRTLGIRASKAARNIDRKIVNLLKTDDAKAEVIIEGIR
jgi:uncharacterized protein